jgi:sugar phosphate isomerase/epimerase
LLELPARLAAFGLSTLEICHFHLPSREKRYLAELRSALQESNIELFSLLIDNGDITDTTHAARDLAWMANWIEIAGDLGAKRARVIAGKAEPSEEALKMSVRGLRHLVERAQASGIRLMTENWFALFSQPEAVLTVLDQLEGNVGLCVDFGNWRGSTKYQHLAAIVDRAESCHAKAHFTAPGVMDTEDFTRCIALTRTVHFAGPYTLIYDGPDPDEWQGLAQEREVLLSYERG